jgi:hypothetical protein
MRLPIHRGNAILTIALLLAVAGGSLRGQTAPASPAGAGGRASRGIPPRANASEYLSKAQAGTVTIAAEFDGHSVPTPEATLSTEDFVAVEVAFFGPPNAKATVSFSDFSLRVNGKKAALPAEQFAAVFRNLRDPSWTPPEEEKKSSKPAINTGGGGGGNQDSEPGGSPPPVVHIPPELERAMQQHVQNAALPEGERALPIDGLLFFRYTGAAKGIHTVELVYAGSAGKAVIAMQP